ncbi:YrhK-like protein [Limimonas halophila]|uniref:YrhK-like protein n=1 Tax=Limimonas halophila TaxID=1082479 RepID=A0A1G7LIN8_9PROT|nr:YrhK family protein [Limimonas halophila]SDF49335.1 YrhK-like protein [Limimonas halophila]
MAWRTADVIAFACALAARLAERAGWRAFCTFLREYEWIHRGTGILGHLCFFVGSVFFLWESLKLAGVWLFIVGAGGMLVDRVGSLIVHFERLHERGEPLV